MDVEAILAKLRHNHKYKEVAAAVRTNTTTGFITSKTTDTLVLHRCTECGDKYVQELPGEWTLAQARGESA